MATLDWPSLHKDKILLRGKCQHSICRVPNALITVEWRATGGHSSVLCDDSIHHLDNVDHNESLLTQVGLIETVIGEPTEGNWIDVEDPR